MWKTPNGTVGANGKGLRISKFKKFSQTIFQGTSSGNAAGAGPSNVMSQSNAMTGANSAFSNGNVNAVGANSKASGMSASSKRKFLKLRSKRIILKMSMETLLANQERTQDLPRGKAILK